MKLLKKFFSFSIGSVIGILISVVSLPIITRLISPEEFGQATIFLNIGLILSVIALAGVDQAFIRLFYNSNRINLFIKTLFISLTVTFLLGIFLFLFNEELSNLILKGNSYWLLMSFYVLCVVLLRFANLILRMQQFAIRFSIVEIIKKIGDFLFVISIALLFVPNHYALIIGYSMSLLIAAVVSLILSRDFWKSKENNTEKVNYKNIIKYSLPFMFSGLIAILIQTLDKLFLGYWGTTQEVGLYSASFKLIALINIVQHIFNLFWTPVYLEHYKNFPNDNEFFARVARVMTFVMIALCMMIILFKDLLILFLGSDYHEDTSIIAILVLMPVFMTMSETTMIGINLKMKPKYHIYISISVLIISLFLSITLIPTLGAKGAAFSVGISYLFFYLFRTMVGQRMYKYDIKFKSTLIIIFFILIWISLIIFYEINYVLQFLGAVVIFLLLVIIFYQDIIIAKKELIQVIKKK